MNDNPVDQAARLTKTGSIASDYVLAFFVVILSFTVLWCATKILPPTWDEGEMGRRADQVAQWIQQVLHIERNDSSFSNFSSDSIRAVWRGTITAEGHPQFPVLLAASGRLFFAGPTTIESLRFGSVLFFATALGAVFYRTKTDFGLTVASCSVLSILLIPRLFAHAQIAAWDSALTASWLWTWAVFPAALKHLRGALLFGFFLGITFSCKFSGFAAAIPFGIWLVVFLLDNREACVLQTLFRIELACLVAVLTFFLFNPPLWHDPGAGFMEFFRLNTNRSVNVAILFRGTMFDLHHSLPWYNTIFWILITVPSTLLFFAAVGLIGVRRDRGKGLAVLLILFNFLTLPIIRSFPGTPVHDGVRLFITAFPFLGILAGIGAARIWNDVKHNTKDKQTKTYFSRKIPSTADCRRGIQKLIVPVLYSACICNLFWYAPQWLSYYNILIGGLPGAVRSGMEPTYYWDAFDGEVIDWLSKHTEPGESVGFSIGSSRSFQLSQRRYGFSFRPVVIKPAETIEELRQQDIRFYVLQRRPSAEFERDIRLIRSGHVVYKKTIRRDGIGPWNLNRVPILEIYSIASQRERLP